MKDLYPLADEAGADLQVLDSVRMTLLMLSLLLGCLIVLFMGVAGSFEARISGLGGGVLCIGLWMSRLNAEVNEAFKAHEEGRVTQRVLSKALLNQALMRRYSAAPFLMVVAVGFSVLSLLAV